MMIFDLLINCIEAYLFSMFIANYFNLNNKRIYIILTTIIQLLILQYAIMIDYNGIILSLTIVVFMILSIFVANKKLIFEHVYMVINYNAFIIACAIIASIFLIGVDGNLLYILRCIIAKIIQFTLTVMILKKHKHYNITFNMKDWGFLLLIEGFILSSVIISFTTIVIGTTSKVAYLFFISSIIVSFLFSYTIIRLNHMNQELIESVRLEQIKKENEEKRLLLNQIKKDVSLSEHRLYYMVLQLKNAISEMDSSNLDTLLKNYEKLINKNKIYVDTGNPIFDSLYGIKVNEMILSDIDINNVINITKNDRFYNAKFCEFISNLLDYFIDAKQIQMIISDNTNFCLIKIIYRNAEVDTDKLIEYLERNINKIGLWNMKHFETEGLKITINMEKWIN